VSEASSIVQEAADEDANIIFGAVVDPALKGKVKITVIATGFGSHAAARPAGSAAQTPVDMAQFNDGARMRVEPPSAAPAATTDRLTLRRLSGGRRAMDIPLTIAPSAPGNAAAGGGATLPLPNLVETDPSASGPEDDATLAFDVPAFLRRQEG
jgi:FtsZ family protein